MKKLFLLGILTILPQYVFSININFVGNTKKIIEITPDKSTGLEKIYVVNDCSLISELVIRDCSAQANVMTYSNLGGGFAQPVSSSYMNGELIIPTPVGNSGYIIEENGRNTCFWIIDYKTYQLKLNSITADDYQDCDATQINIGASGGEPIYYFSIDGRQVELSREISLKYYNLSWNEEAKLFEQVDSFKELSHISNPVRLSPPLYCNTIITASGDRFQKEWGEENKIESNLIYANGINVASYAEQTNINDGEDEESSNLIKTETGGLGGSAPADFSFVAYTTDAVVHNEWQIASDENFEYIDYRFNQQTLDYTFSEEGTYYVRFVGSNSDGSCEAIGETYQISIGASDLRIPNAFTPNDDGVNDIWKVGYRSLLNFRCSIFDRYGNQIYTFNDPSQGWDGKYKGKLVKPGVYYYVIEATGADGKKYKKGGDINLLRSKRTSTQEN